MSRAVEEAEDLCCGFLLMQNRFPPSSFDRLTALALLFLAAALLRPTMSTRLNPVLLILEKLLQGFLLQSQPLADADRVSTRQRTEYIGRQETEQQDSIVHKYNIRESN